MKERGVLITCDECNDKGYFVADSSTEIYPEDWEVRDGKDICPNCVDELKAFERQINIFE